MKKLKERSMRHIEQNPYTALWSILNNNNYRRFVNVPYGVLRCILQSEGLRVEEKDLWTYAFSWAQHECDRKDLPRNGHNIRLVLGDLFSLIKFPLISKAGFTNIEKCGIVTFDGSRSTGKMYSGVFTGQELDEMHNYYATGERPTFMSDFQFIPREYK
uniref:Uncharacterized protein n=1 Tax=Acrobeloides nanus TaxID=290746 RepID=A0A914ES09_9BILA